MDLQSPSFSLVDHNGRHVTLTDFAGKVTIVFFGFSNCLKVCPRALDRLTKVLDIVDSSANCLNALYISIDPERDTPGVLKTFLGHHSNRFIGLTGTQDQVSAAQQAFRVFAQRKQDDGHPGGYAVSHTAITYVLDPEGRLADHLNDSLETSQITARIANVVEQYASQFPEMKGNETRVGCSRPLGGESLGRLDKKQVASLRHIGNLARQPRGDWSNMMGDTDLNDGFGAYRFQLAYAAYALSLAHFHRLPAAPGLFKTTLERLIEKMCHTDVWFYWRDASTGGGIGRTPRKKGATDPIAKDNIMYSAYLQSITALYSSLFNDDRYTKPGSLTLQHEPFFWGDGGFRFEYDQKSLNEIVYWQMVEQGYIGVACEPGCVFQICNQPPILGFRLNDVLYGGNTAQEVTAGYLKAWDDYGSPLDSEGDYRYYLIEHTQQIVPSIGPGMDAWCAMLMHSWNPAFVEEAYNKQKSKWFKRHEDGKLSVQVKDISAKSPVAPRLLHCAELGWVAACAAEVGDNEALEGLLAFADDRLLPRYQNGGLMYPRQDTMLDEEGNYVLSSPMQSNALFPLARLNVPSGFERLYRSPWGPKNKQHYEEPALTVVDFDIDVFRAVYLADEHRLLFDVAVFETGAKGSVELSHVFGRGDWTLCRDGQRAAWGSSSSLESCTGEEDVKCVGERLTLTVSDTRVSSYVLQWQQ